MDKFEKFLDIAVPLSGITAFLVWVCVFLRDFGLL